MTLNIICTIEIASSVHNENSQKEPWNVWSWFAMWTEKRKKDPGLWILTFFLAL